jgi:hypothetical protein
VSGVLAPRWFEVQDVCVEEQLSGGNTNAAVVKVGSTVRRPTGPWTPRVHELLRRLESSGFEGAPRVRGIDERGREILTNLAAAWHD